MALAVLHDALRLVLASWRGQLLVLAVGAVTAGLLGQFGADALGMRGSALALAVVSVLLVGLSARAAQGARAGHDTEPIGLAGDAVRLAPRLVTQSVFAIAPAAIAAWAGMASISLYPLLGLVTIPLAFTILVLVQPALLLAIGSVVHGDRSWLPLAAASVVRQHPFSLAGTTLVGGVAAGMLAIPLVLFGMVLGAVLGFAGLLGTGLAMVAALPLLGCGAAALWIATGVTHVAATTRQPDEVDVAAALAPMAWLDGPSWHVAIDAGSVWGTWIRIDLPATMGISVSWTDGPAPHLSLSTESGAWTEPGDPHASGSIVPVALPAGSTYVQLASRAQLVQPVTLRLLVQASAAAA